LQKNWQNIFGFRKVSVFSRPVFCSVWLFISILVASLCSTNLRAVVAPTPNHIGFAVDPSQIKPSIQLRTKDKSTKIAPAKQQILKRVRMSAKDQRIEPFTLRVPISQKKLLNFVNRLAKPKRKLQLLKFFEEKKLIKDPKIKGIAKSVRTKIGEKQLRWLKPKELRKEISRDHHIVKLPSEQFELDPELRTKLLRQVKPHIGKENLSKIIKRMRRSQSISVNKMLLPRFADKMVGKFTTFRGPNCFHAALAFHGKRLTNSPFFNVKAEKGYHRAMINYDELWRTLNSNFFEIDPRKTQAKYGDILVFMDVPDHKSPINFRWIRHAAVYLFDDYTFSKGSKSPDTPYALRTLSEEWSTWRRLTKNLGVKVYRRTSNHVKTRPPVSLTDWLY
jgi:hypothetical protein